MTRGGLTWSVAALMAVASSAPLLRPGLYRDNDLVASGWLGNDLITLLVATPALLLAARSARGGSERARLVWMGILAYAAYNFAFYLFGSALNPLFLVYAAVVALSLTGLGLGAATLLRAPEQALAGATATAQSGVFAAPPRHRGVAGFILGTVTALGGFWVVVSLDAALTGRTPAMVAATGLHTNLVAALDLTVIVPAGLLAGAWLWTRNPAGHLLGAIWSVQGAVYMAALAAATVTAALAGHPVPLAQAALWGALGVGCLVSSRRLLADFAAAPGARASVP